MSKEMGGLIMQKSLITDLDECKRLWEVFVRPQNISNLWEFRLCFQRHFKWEPYFLILKDRKGIAGMLPLSYLEEPETFVFFPGETWKGKTWNERSPLYVREKKFLPELFFSCPERTYLRYIDLSNRFLLSFLDVDEIGYALYPGRLGFDLTRYYDRFSNKKLKDIRKTIRALTNDESTFHLNRLEDFDLLVDMSLQRFGSESYLYDDRFTKSFRDSMHFLHRRGWLRMVSLEIKGKTAAVDMGALFNGTYTVFLGGTDSDFPGIAKAMNMQHIEFAFKERISKIDFLCGDFHWKKLWHLDPEPLYRFVTPALSGEEQAVNGIISDSFSFLKEARRYA
jgi:hypothetical protein